MKKIIISSSFLLIALASIAGKCKYVENGTDAFTGEQKRTIKTILWGNAMFNYLTWVTKQVGDDYTVELGLVFQGERNRPIDTSEAVIVKLEDGTTFSLYPKNETHPTSTVASSTIYSIYAPNYVITKEQLDKMAASRITMMRFAFEKNYDFDFNKRYKKNCEKLQKSIPCVLNDPM